MVLWAAALISLTLAGVLSLERDDYRRARDMMVAAQLRALADAAIWSTAYDLQNSQTTESGKLDGSFSDWHFEGHLLRVSVQDDLGKVDLNLASQSMLRRVFLAAGADEQEADRLADCVQDWRERGLSKRLNGAKSDDYASAGLAYGPREGPFLSVEELDLVLGMKQALFQSVWPSFTVYSESPSVDPNFASAAVLLALTDDDIARAQLLMSERNGRAVPVPTLVGHTITIEVTVKTGEMRVKRKAILRLTGQLSKPFDVYVWR